MGIAISRLTQGILGSGDFKTTAVGVTLLNLIANIRRTQIETPALFVSPIIVRLQEPKECGPDKRERGGTKLTISDRRGKERERRERGWERDFNEIFLSNDQNVVAYMNCFRMSVSTIG